jgi:hypothetical protein
MYWINLWKELMIWREVKQVAIKNYDVLRENNLRVDWIGRIYTVFNLPIEVIETPSTRELWLSSQLKLIDDVLLQLNLSDIVYPEFNQITGSDSYLLVLSAESEYLNLSRFIFNLIGTCILVYISIVFFRWLNSFKEVHNFLKYFYNFL